MTAFEFLSQGRFIDRRIEHKLEDIARMRSKLTNANAKLSDMPKGGQNTDWTDADIKILEYEQYVGEEIKKLCDIKRQIREAIDAVDDARFRELLEMRYINNKTFEEIAVAMKYDWRWTMRLHKTALGAVKVPEKANTP